MNADAPEKRQHCVSVRLSPSELAELDNRRGRTRRGTYLRHAFENNLPVLMPAINHDAWIKLGKSLGNLATIATAMRGGDFVELEAIREAIKETRLRLTGAQLSDKQKEQSDEGI